MKEISFEAAIAHTEQLLEQLLRDSSPDSDTLKQAVIELLKTSNGARGFFVALLTGTSPLADQPSPAIIEALQAVPDPSAELMVKNLVMPTAMAITHQRNGDEAQANNSRQVARRSLNLIQAWQSPEVARIARTMYQSATTATGEYVDFLNKWGYDLEQLGAIANILTPIISPGN